ncbi:MAG: toxin-activating lysine-acyltransferase [Candidatus Accumulibacter sp.]|uniref:RTX toxin-activating lysine-acyltransferase n=1 Tax=Candidatus Accumulibacter proximus TaxID=2954385 RepID=A0A935PZD5_9PROT|nr:toxin-activating lysine-acyltransferase [Candidatus Accumulibacter proximus]
MLATEEQSVTRSSVSEAPSAAAPLRAVRTRDGRQALGMAVSYLMTDPVYARLPFGQWSRVLVGQINRGHYLFAMEGEKVVGFVGWALTTKEKAEAWLNENRDIGFADSMAGEIVLLNVWKADGDAVNRVLVEAVRRVISDREMVYAKRFYRDGRLRPVRLPVSRFVEGHVSRSEALA